MRILITGAQGMLGRDVVTAFQDCGHDVTAAGRADLDITDAASVTQAVATVDAVINCAAYTAVDDAEDHEAEAFAINAVGPGILATAAAEKILVHVSTDYVFSGDAAVPYPADHQINPINAYGRTKAAGEWAVRANHLSPVIVRTAWLYGAHGGCFPKTIARLGHERGALNVIADQIGQPTWTADVADLICRLVDSGAPAGSYHATATGPTSWYDFARAIISSAGLDAGIVSPITTAEFPQRATRPPYSVLAHDSLEAAGVDPIGAWQDRWAAAATHVLATQRPVAAS